MTRRVAITAEVVRPDGGSVHGDLGLQPAEGLYVILARIFSVIYFLFFALMPWYTRIEKVKTPPERVTYDAH